MSDERSAAILAAYYGMTAQQRERVALGIWFCPAAESCLLLTVWQSPAGRLGATPNYTLSRSLNEAESTHAGRKANTRDGDRHWIGSGLEIDEPQYVNVTLECRHYRGLLDRSEILVAIDGAKPGKPVRRVIRR